MARISDAINRGLENLSTSPLGMASLGLLMQPSMSRTPINPFAYAAQGMQMGLKNRALKQEALAQQERARSQEEARRARLLMDVQRYQQEEMKMRMAQQEQARQAQAMQELMSTLSPEEARMAAVLGPDYVKQMMQQRMQRPTSLQQNLMAAGLQPGTPEFQQAMMTAINRPQVQIGGQIKAPTGYMVNAEGTGVVPIPGLPPKPAPMTPEQQVQQSAEMAEASARAKAKVKDEISQQGVQEAVQDMYSAVRALRKDITNPDALETVDQERKRLAQVLAARRNPGRAPTDTDVEMALQDIPNTLSIRQGVGAIFGGDPFTARMKVLERELGLTQTPAGATVSTDFTRSGSSKARRGVLPSGHQYEVVED